MSGVGGTSLCGNGIVDSTMGEQCEPTISAGMPTCPSLGMGQGMVVCNNACRLMMMCSGVVPVGGDGTGEGSGTGGSQG